MMWLAIVLMVATVLAILAYGSSQIASGMFVTSHCHTSDGSVMLTFDDGPCPETTPAVLDVLRKHNAKAIFFVIGKQAEAHQQLLQRIVAEGHEVGNHTYHHHPKYIFATTARYERELELCRAAMEKAGVETRLFRPPLGVTNPTIAHAVQRLGYKVAGWSVRSFDTRGESRQRVFARVARQLKPGAVVLLHDRLPDAAQLADSILIEIKNRGLAVANPKTTIQ